jgi:hypothetical protein
LWQPGGLENGRVGAHISPALGARYDGNLHRLDIGYAAGHHQQQAPDDAATGRSLPRRRTEYYPMTELLAGPGKSAPIEVETARVDAAKASRRTCKIED